MGKERFEAFTDAVLAIILTILVLEIHLDQGNHSLSAIVEVLPEFLAYVVSFIIISVMWVNHHYLFLRVKEINHRMIFTNIFLLFWATLLPATTAWFGSDINARIPALLYALNVIIYNFAFSALRNEVVKTQETLTHKMKLEVISVIINALALVIVFVWPPFVFFSLLLDVALWAVQPIRANRKMKN